jgi:pyrimidine-nucleoside phosphorylase
MRTMIAAQYGNPEVVDHLDLLPSASMHRDLLAERSGVLASVDTAQVGWAAIELGAGRERVESCIDPAVGIELRVRLGQPLVAGEPMLTVHANDASRLERALVRLRRAYRIEDEAPAPGPLVLDRIERG